MGDRKKQSLTLMGSVFSSEMQMSAGGGDGHEVTSMIPGGAGQNDRLWHRSDLNFDSATCVYDNDGHQEYFKSPRVFHLISEIGTKVATKLDYCLIT